MILVNHILNRLRQCYKLERLFMRFGINVFFGCLTLRSTTTKYHQRSYQLGTHRIPILKFLARSCDHSTSDIRDRGHAWGHRFYLGTSSHLLSHVPRISADFG